MWRWGVAHNVPLYENLLGALGHGRVQAVQHPVGLPAAEALRDRPDRPRPASRMLEDAAHGRATALANVQE